jgi:hypothetical protein
MDRDRCMPYQRDKESKLFVSVLKYGPWKLHDQFEWVFMEQLQKIIQQQVRTIFLYNWRRNSRRIQSKRENDDIEKRIRPESANLSTRN